ncbi:MAG: hypothetical protein PWQ27_292 [Kosmotoga sp.]|nr:hypothetical protein [Kosmotoga sp.]MDK2952909.1 hypothetical protein [Kosmotoga sp.]
MQHIPMTREEMKARGWDQLDVILITGDAYVDHPSFGVAIIARVLEAKGFKVGVISQPDWKNPEEITKLGKPKLFFGITAGNVDSLVANYTASRKKRKKMIIHPVVSVVKGRTEPQSSIPTLSAACSKMFLSFLVE